MLKAVTLMLDAQRILTPMGGQQGVQEAATAGLRAAAELEAISSKVGGLRGIEGGADAGK